MSHFYRLDDMAYRFKRAGVHIKTISGDSVQMVFVRLEPGFISDHAHPEEQMGMVISGSIRLTIGDETQVLENGHVYHVPANMRHSFSVLSEHGAEIMDIFCPPKEENAAAPF